MDQYKSAVKAQSNKSLPLENISNVAAEGLPEEILRTKGARNYYLFDGKGCAVTGSFTSSKFCWETWSFFLC